MRYKDFGLVNTDEMLGRALHGGYAVPAYNFNNLEQLQAILIACEQTESPVILQVSKGARKYIGKEVLLAMVSAFTKNTKIPIALHLDHGTDFDICKDCIDMGFSSVMIDASSKSFDENIALSKQVADYAHKYNVSVEAELGALVGIEDELNVEQTSYTNPDDVVQFVKLTGVDSLAISIGTSHGAYKMKSPTGKLRFDILEKIQQELPDFPLVLHGASSVPEKLINEINKYGGKITGALGIPEDQLIQARKMNICKINVDSDARLAFTAGVRQVLFENMEVFDPRIYLSAARDKMIELYKDKNINVMGSAGKI
ncbi:MAG: class II fructose-1,6-bisphosphate aldolase [Alphaproteobacteria bacterium]|jgi:fructose-bisphosphate aldolase class II|nr:class II fructose-1,6-bisphosphate aldolase [Alphaproteobacteria bacterium]